jgi:hypothetical protein
MNELTNLLDALDAAIAKSKALHTAVEQDMTALISLRGAVFDFGERIQLAKTLDTFPKEGPAVAPDALDPCPTVEELRDMLQKAAAKDQKRVREIIAEEAGGKKIVDMTDRERQLVRISLEMSGLKK